MVVLARSVDPELAPLGCTFAVGSVTNFDTLVNICKNEADKGCVSLFILCLAAVTFLLLSL